MLNATRMNLINALVLIAMGLWGYLELNSPTALIPVGFGVVLLLCYQGVKNQNKIIVHVAVLLTLLILIALGWNALTKVNYSRWLRPSESCGYGHYVGAIDGLFHKKL